MRNADSVASAANLPQVRIYNQYAAMFEYYQIDKFTARFIPYKWEMTSSNVGTSPANARPTYSIIDPEADNPTTPSGFCSYGNCLVTVPYKENSRTVDYQSLVLQKQDKVMLKTNGSHSQRDRYTDPMLIGYLAQCPNLGNTVA